MKGLEPPCLSAPDPKSGVSTNFTTPAVLFKELLSFFVVANIENFILVCQIFCLQKFGFLRLIQMTQFICF